MNTQLLSQYGFFRVYKPLARHFQSNDTALLLSHFIDLQEVFLKDKLIDGMFFQQQERIMDYCNLKRHTLRECTKTLFEAGLLAIEKKGMPAVNHYRVFIDKVLELINNLDSNHKWYEKLTTSDDTTTSDIENSITSDSNSAPHNNNILNNNLHKENVYSEKDIINIPDRLLDSKQRAIKSQLIFQ